jgi:hypothetical protein
MRPLYWRRVGGQQMGRDRGGPLNRFGKSSVNSRQHFVDLQSDFYPTSQPDAVIQRVILNPHANSPSPELALEFAPLVHSEDPDWS